MADRSPTVERKTPKRTTHRVLTQVLAAAVILLIAKTVVSVVASYGNYFPPNFDRGFLAGRSPHFVGLYRLAFYAHIVTGPISLVLGTVLLIPALLRSPPRWHRCLGRIQGIVVMTVVGPSGLVMAFRPAAGTVAGVGLACLAVATTACCYLGWRAAIGRRYEVHRRWMTRTFILLFSAVVIRVLGGAGAVLDVSWPGYNATIVWASWVGPIGLYEGFVEISAQRARRRC